jgi:hypothetical protein
MRGGVVAVIVARQRGVHLDYTFSQWEKLQDDDRTAV